MPGVPPIIATPHPERPLKVLLVDDESAVRGALAAMLDAMGHQVYEAHDATWALTLLDRHRPDVALLDVEMPQRDGYWLARAIREREGAEHWTPIIFLSGRDGDADLARGIESGGDDYLIKPASATVLAAKLRAMQRLMAAQTRLSDLSQDLKASNEALRHLSEHDALTGLLNRRGFDERAGRALDTARRNGTPLTLVLCDIDYFKRYNDHLGHAAGDDCLRRIGALMRQICRRPGDHAARYGGEEFALILADTPKSGALTLARTLGRLLAVNALPHPDSDAAPYVTLSGGLTTCLPGRSSTIAEMLKRADEVLYLAKANGRNRYYSFEQQFDAQRDKAEPENSAGLAR